jgi:hypothetical protein
MPQSLRMLGCVHEHDLVGVVGVGLLPGFRELVELALPTWGW